VVGVASRCALNARGRSPGHARAGSSSPPFGRLVDAIDTAFVRWDRAHMHMFTLTDRGDAGALQDLAELREQAGDHTGADRLQRFGLADDGAPASTLG
jgi:hypothetical protein